MLPFYVSYRAAVRAKVEWMTAAEPEVPEADRDAARRSARAHWLLAVGALEVPERRPCLVLIGGLPGTGKSTLAKALAAAAGLEVVRSDVVRKALAAAAGAEERRSMFGAGLYSPEWTERTYAECLRQASDRLDKGERVAIDASFGREASRRAFFDAAKERGVPAVMLQCQADPTTVRTRLEARAGQGDASDADWPIHVEAAARWELPSLAASRLTRTIDASATVDSAAALGLAALREFGLI